VKLICGLGNPGLKYKYTRHNVGFMALDNFKNKAKGGKKAVFLKPQVFMNNSGIALKKAMNTVGAEITDVLVVCDDINLELGIIRVRARGSAGGHRGLQSIIDELGTEDFNRLRLGIGAIHGAALRDYVLSKFKPDEKKILKEVLEKAAEAIGVWIKEGIEAAMNRFNIKNVKARCVAE